MAAANFGYKEDTMKKNTWLGRALAVALCAALATQTFAVGAGQQEPTLYDKAVQHYTNGAHELIKISHPDQKANTRQDKVKTADGIVDYLGNGALALPGTAEGANGQGDRGQSYCWGSVAYGDYMYVNTLFSAAGSTATLFPQAGVGDMGPDMVDKVTDALYKGDLFLHEEDNGNPGCVLVKINVKTGDTKLIMSKEDKVDSYGNDYGGYYQRGGMNPQFRNALEFNGKLYFCGAPGGLPSIWEVDPENGDAFRRIYVDETVAKNPQNIIKAMNEDKLCVTIRGMTVFQDRLVISCVGFDANPYITISKTSDPADGFVKIASAYVEDPLATDNYMKPDPNPEKGELLGYPACRITDSIYGGSIWEMAEFDGRLYVAICTGTQDLSDGKKPGNAPMQSFALMCGVPGEDLTDRSAWTWHVVAGDKADGAKYTFGIDPERTRAGACCMRVFNDHLYIGEYNDSEVALIQMLADGFNSSFMADNLEQSVSLYRMDKDENFELAAGQPTRMFPEGSLSGLYSGFGEGRNEYSNQYIWQMKVFQNKLYIGTFDQGTLLYPLAQLSNGDILDWTPEQWKEQLDYLKALLESMKKDPHNPDQPQAAALLEAQNQAEALMNLQPLDALTMPQVMSADNPLNTVEKLHHTVSLLPPLLEQDDSWTLEQKIASKQSFAKLYDKMFESYQKLKTQLPPGLQEIYDKMLNEHDKQVIQSMARTLYYMQDAVCGFDLYVLSENPDGTVTVDTISKDGLGDPYNHGIRAFAANDSQDNPWLTLGTANMCYGTQVWRLEGQGLNLPTWANPFEDVHEDDYFYEAVKWGVINHVTAGVTPTLFSPDSTCTRAEMVTFLWNAAGQPAPETQENPFTDVAANEWYYQAVLWAVEKGVTAGVSPTEFAPGLTCDRAQAMTFLWNYMGQPTADVDMPFTDVTEKDWFYGAIQWAVENDITVGTSATTFGSLDPCTRAHIITFLYRALAE